MLEYTIKYKGFKELSKVLDMKIDALSLSHDFIRDISKTYSDKFGIAELSDAELPRTGFSDNGCLIAKSIDSWKISKEEINYLPLIYFNNFIELKELIDKMLNISNTSSNEFPIGEILYRNLSGIWSDQYGVVNSFDLRIGVMINL